MLEKIETELVDDFNTMLDSCIETRPDPDPYLLCVHSFLMQTEHQETVICTSWTAWGSGFCEYMKGIVQKRMAFYMDKECLPYG